MIDQSGSMDDDAAFVAQQFSTIISELKASSTESAGMCLVPYVDEEKTVKVHLDPQKSLATYEAEMRRELGIIAKNPHGGLEWSFDAAWEALREIEQHGVSGSKRKVIVITDEALQIKADGRKPEEVKAYADRLGVEFQIIFVPNRSYARSAMEVYFDTLDTLGVKDVSSFTEERWLDLWEKMVRDETVELRVKEYIVEEKLKMVSPKNYARAWGIFENYLEDFTNQNREILFDEEESEILLKLRCPRRDEWLKGKLEKNKIRPIFVFFPLRDELNRLLHQLYPERDFKKQQEEELQRFKPTLDSDDKIDLLLHMNPEDFEKVVILLEDPNPRVVESTITLLGQSKNPKAAAHLMNYIEHHSNDNVFKVIATLGNFREPVVVDFLIDLYQKPGTTSSEKYFIIESLKEIGSRKANEFVAKEKFSSDYLEELRNIEYGVEHGDWESREAIKYFLCVAGDEYRLQKYFDTLSKSETKEELEQLLIDRIKNEKCHHYSNLFFIEKLGEIGSCKSISFLSDFLIFPNDMYVEASKDAIAAIEARINVPEECKK